MEKILLRSLLWYCPHPQPRLHFVLSSYRSSSNPVPKPLQPLTLWHSNKNKSLRKQRFYIHHFMSLELKITNMACMCFQTNLLYRLIFNSPWKEIGKSANMLPPLHSLYLHPLRTPLCFLFLFITARFIWQDFRTFGSLSFPGHPELFRSFLLPLLELFLDFGNGCIKYTNEVLREYQ